MSRKRTIKYGVIVYFIARDEYQEAINKGVAAFREHYDQEANLIHLPRGVDADSFNINPLALADTPASPGTIIVGVG